MFEYLMPEIFFDTHRDTLLGRSVDGAVRAQIAYGRWENIPWGISESAYYALDRHREYKYKAFGVYETALSSCPRERVVSPYSTILAMERFPRESMENLVKLVQRGCAGSLGMFEAIDFTHSRGAMENYNAGERPLPIWLIITACLCAPFAICWKFGGQSGLYGKRYDKGCGAAFGREASRRRFTAEGARGGQG